MGVIEPGPRWIKDSKTWNNTTATPSFKIDSPKTLKSIVGHWKTTNGDSDVGDIVMLVIFPMY